MAGTAQTHKTPQRGIIESANQERFGGSRFRGFFKRNIRDWMAPMERFIFWAISSGFIPEVSSLRSISSSVSVQRRPAGRGPLITPSPSSPAAVKRLAEKLPAHAIFRSPEAHCGGPALVEARERSPVA
jgi:hypothetical protein